MSYRNLFQTCQNIHDFQDLMRLLRSKSEAELNSLYSDWLSLQPANHAIHSKAASQVIGGPLIDNHAIHVWNDIRKLNGTSI